MTRRTIFSIVAFCLRLGLLSIFVVSDCAYAQESERLALGTEVHFSSVTASKPRTGAIQVLIDASASMNGYATSIDKLLGTIEQGFTGIRGLHLQITNSRSCYFRRQSGKGILLGCSSGLRPQKNQSAKEYSGYTSLDSAVREAKDFALTVVLTDGVPASVGTNSDCSMGVDSSCVAEALANVLRPKAGASANESKGFWIVPIVTMFTGSFFTEAPLSKENYQPERIRKNVEEYFGLSAETDNPQVESKLGTLMFRYKGPRFLLALVISEHAELGRAFLQFVYLKAEFSGTKKIMSPGEFKQGLALMPPVEVYPGFAKSPKWTRIEAVRGPGGRNLQTGNLSGQLAESNRITVSCQRDRVNSGPFTLSAVDRASPDSVLIRVLPSRRLVLEGGGSRFLRNAKWDNNRADATTNNLMLSFGLVCDQSWSVTCGSKVEQVKWDILPNYEESSSSLRDTSTKSASLRYVQSLSTINPADEPHRIYGLVDLIASLYSWNLPVRKQNFTFLEFCQRTGQ